jgi:hypothetical protein
MDEAQRGCEQPRAFQAQRSGLSLAGGCLFSRFVLDIMTA